MNDTLDIRDSKQFGMSLAAAINQAVKDTQSLITNPLPSKIIMTKDQYRSLQHDPEMLDAYEGEHLYRTYLNIMEVSIK